MTPCRASIAPEECHGTALEGAMSKIYEFSPSGFTIQNKIMFVIPLFDSHHYDYDNLTLMYRKDRHSEFVDANELEVHKPAWLFYGNRCYIFLDHFCGIHVGKQTNDSGQEVKCITLNTLLFYKQTDRFLELITTFACYNKKSTCSYKKLTTVLIFKFKGNILRLSEILLLM